ncbi:MAG: ABC transporter ATP-binding protein [Rhodospirillum sp.]|nr:ABC transporter ATP-binding protein [Rhodospirillum sp.]MCF8489148.1 ABC transporter ATP-binding protein [Rhodospirillum sp.]
MSESDPPLLSIENLSVRFGDGTGAVDAVRGVSLTINRGETLALVGESGSGKSVTALSILRLLPETVASHPSGTIRLEGEDLLTASPRRLRQVRGDRVAMIFQEPMTSLNPLHAIERQVGEVLTLHKGLDGKARRNRVVELLSLVGLPDPEKRLSALPHELSGGQRQRVMIAMALANEPDLLIADEPTTALDVTIQAQILALLADLRCRFGMAVLFITHDLSVVRRIADRVAVMQGGKVVETNGTAALFANPQHPYTKTLLGSQPRGRAVPAPEGTRDILSCEDIRIWFPIKKGLIKRTVDHIKAVDGVSLSLKAGETLGIVGESGSGKTTLGLGLLRLTGSRGSILFDGQRIDGLSSSVLRPLRRRMQVVFQDPYGSLSPRLSIGDIVGEGLEVHGIAKNRNERRVMVSQVLEEVGLDPATQDRYPHEFSGGQRQRVSIARALVLKPELIVLDEPTSALDVTVQAQIVDLLRDLQSRHGLAYIFISHDLRVVRALASQILVMKDGKVVESGPAESVFTAPQAPYTQALLAAALDLKADQTGVVKN